MSGIIRSGGNLSLNARPKKQVMLQWTLIAAANKAVEKAAYAAAVAECEARDAAPGTAEIVMRTVLDIVKLSEAELIEWKKNSACKKVFALYDNNAHAAYTAAMKVFYHATMAAMDEARDAFDTAYAASMSGRIPNQSFMKGNATD